MFQNFHVVFDVTCRNVLYVRTLRYGTLWIDTYRSTVCYGFLRYVTWEWRTSI